MKSVNRLTALVAGVSLLICGILSHQYLGKDKRLSVLQKGYLREMAKVREHHASVRVLIEANKSLTFKEFTIPSTYPYFVFRDSVLGYWSTNYYIPPYGKAVAERGAESFIYDGEMSYVVVRTAFMSNGQHYDIVSLVDLVRDENYVHNFKVPDYNTAVFFLKPDKISPTAFDGGLRVLSSDQQPVFYAGITENLQYLSFKISPVSIVLIVIGVLLIWYTMYVQSIYLSHRHKYIRAGILMALSFVTLRLLMRYFNIPWIFFHNKALDIFYGNLFVDMLCVLIVLTKVALTQYKALLYINLEVLNSTGRKIFSLFCVLVVVLVGHGIWWLIDLAYQDSLIENYYSVSFYLSNVKDTIYVYLFILLGIYFLCIHSLANLYRRLQPHKKQGAIYWLVGSLAGVVVSRLWAAEFPVIITSLFFLTVYLLQLTRYFYRLRSFTYIYYIIGALSYTFLLFNFLFQKEGKQSESEKYTFASHYLSGKDRRLERQLPLMKGLADETDIFHRLLAGQISYQEADAQIRKVFWDNSLDHFRMTFELFDSSGREVLPSTHHQLSEFIGETTSQSESTEYENLFLTRDPRQPSHYTYLYEVKAEDSTLMGTALFRLYPNRGSAALTPTEILQVKRVDHNPFTYNYSYGVYDSTGHLIYQYGKYIYPELFDTVQARKTDIFMHEVLFNGYSHIARRGDGNRVIVVSEKRDFYKDAMANFSFLFFMSMIGMVGLLIFMGFFNDFKRYQMNLSGKIQLYLNGAFLMPLTIIMVVGSVVMNSIFSNIRDNSILTTSRGISEALTLYVKNYRSGDLDTRDLRLNLDNLSKVAMIDINIYSLRGGLLYSSNIPYQNREEPLFINPEAVAAIRDRGEPVVLLDDFQDKVRVKTAFVPIRSVANQLTSIGALNFIDAETAVQLWTRQVWQFLLIVFFVIFFVLSVFSFVSSRKLTEPLKLIATKIKSVSFHEKNKEIVWEAKDEIGLLTGEYNRMLKKLDESKQALSLHEKRSAWRDMAKQLAHEIRNPLTPMMLSVQQLQRLVHSDHPDVKKRILKVLGSISDQIENIIGISLSFSKFAEMPLPAREEFDLVAVARDIPEIFRRSPEINLTTAEEELWVRGDSKIIKKTLAYLIKSGIDSVPADRKPIIDIAVTRAETGALLEVRDNGVALPDEIKEKVFRPVFSEKNDEVGFGLSLSKISIEHFGGNIWFESEEGVGKTFFIELQLVKSDADENDEDD